MKAINSRLAARSIAQVQSPLGKRNERGRGRGRNWENQGKVEWEGIGKNHTSQMCSIGPRLSKGHGRGTGQYRYSSGNGIYAGKEGGKYDKTGDHSGGE